MNVKLFGQDVGGTLRRQERNSHRNWGGNLKRNLQQELLLYLRLLVIFNE